MPHKRILASVINTPWLIEEPWLETIVSIVDREDDLEKIRSDVKEALQIQASTKLPDTRVTSYRDNVAIIPLAGTIFPKANIMTEFCGATSLEVLAKDFSEAVESEDIDTIVFAVDSPGGVVTGVSEMASFIKAAGKKVVMYVEGSSASAAYWISTAADEIVMAPTAMVGSIGVVTAYRKSSDDNTLEFVNSASPKKRLDPESDAGKEAIVSMLDDLAEVFIQTVADNRDVTPKVVMEEFGKGGMLVGQKAVDAGMADKVETFEAMMSRLIENDEYEGPVTMPGKMTAEELKAKNPELYESILAQGVASAEATHTVVVNNMTAENKELTKQNGELQATVEQQEKARAANDDRLKVLERKEAIRDAAAVKSTADDIVNGKLKVSTIPHTLHAKVTGFIDHTKFVSEGKLDKDAFSAAADTEIAEWSKGFDAAGDETVQGFGANDDEGAGDQTAVDTNVDRMLGHIGATIQ